MITGAASQDRNMNNMRTVAIADSCQSSLPSISGAAQEIAAATQSPEITFHSSSNLVLVDGIARNAMTDFLKKR